MFQVVFLFLLGLIHQGKCHITDVFGHFIDCHHDAHNCTWIGKDGKSVSSPILLEQFQEFIPETLDRQNALDNFRHHMNFIQKVQWYSKLQNHKLSSTSRLSYQHFYIQPREEDSNNYKDYVHSDMLAQTNAMYQQLDPKRSRRLTQLPPSLNWCSATENPLGINVCTPVKWQKHCGSCWAFSATDAIESAISIAMKQPPIQLSPQQLIDCSHDSHSSGFDYCWVGGSVPGNPWLAKTMHWRSHNQGCRGGMAHTAFQYVSAQPKGITTKLAYPYVEGERSVRSATCEVETRRSNVSATIRTWKQAVGRNCSHSVDVNFLLKEALQQQPIAAAISSQGLFSTYSGGIYTCANSGNTAASNEIDHSVLLVGYGTGPSGNYWILKNSHGVNWGEGGFMKLQEDNKINCGLNIYPVVPLGASGSGTEYVDFGGDNSFLSLSFHSWILIGLVTSAVATAGIIGGYIFILRRPM